MTLRTRPFGSTGIDVSTIGLGAWQLGRSTSWPTGPTPDEAVRIVHAALDAGVNFIDTAPAYADGQSELTLGRALKSVPRDQVVLCTKVGPTHDGRTDWSVDAIAASVEGSAVRMGVDHLDLVVLHSPPPEVLDSPEHYAALETLRVKGRIRAFGASVDHGQDVRTVLTTTSSQALEVRMSALYQETWPAVAEAGTHGAGVIVKVPLESGWLSGRYDASSRFDDVRSRWSAEDVALRAGLVEELRELLPAGLSLVDAALRFLLANEGVCTVIPGTRSLDHLKTSIAAVAEPLPPATVTALRTWYADRLGNQHLEW
ncbi:aldo/keto reductase [Kribbella flavida DSM 17836]|uniref:Aldo/keto reductase n=1 Tax=Kribbella flavida (strain DSM 17836 / JCM 10339 / NBRC 14399) TaxID=479435 RepID=D2PP38_KRIFD|nr:aldo/keto reductase [Kribbella flavida]ADB34634.1 aldo/keto reductase [Kribbella flavida DSM 17836]